MNYRHLPNDSRAPVTSEGLRHLAYLDPQADRAVSQYSPEGEIRMMGELAAGLSRRSGSRPLVLGLIVIILLPAVISLLAVLTTWMA